MVCPFAGRKCPATQSYSNDSEIYGTLPSEMGKNPTKRPENKFGALVTLESRRTLRYSEHGPRGPEHGSQGQEGRARDRCQRCGDGATAVRSRDVRQRVQCGLLAGFDKARALLLPFSI
jgi:hypothetical protein